VHKKAVVIFCREFRERKIHKNIKKKRVNYFNLNCFIFVHKKAVVIFAVYFF
jgi:hypothetical protein